MRLDDYDISHQYEAVMKATTRLTPENVDEVREIVFEVSNFSYKVGQLIGVLVPGPHDLGHAHHFRLYAIASAPNDDGRIEICVKRCNYIDNYSGEQYQGVASHYLCDLKPGDVLTITGPYGLPFELPAEKDADLLMIGLGTGIAPFRAFIKHIYRNIGGWTGRVRLFYGARSGLETVYMNDQRDDFTNYYDEETFAAFKALSPRPHWAETEAFDSALMQHQQEVWDMIDSPNTYIYIAGLESIRETLNDVFATMAGSKEKWARKKAELVAGKRWIELIY